MALIVSEKKLKGLVKPHTAVLVGGYWDLLHAGHLLFLQDCRKKGHPLIVQVLSDRAARLRKGKERPIIPQKQRAEMISQIHGVDYVFIGSRTTHDASYLSAIQPKVVVFAIENMKVKREYAKTVEEKFPKVKVAFIPKRYKGVSTSTIIERIIRRRKKIQRMKK